MLAAVFDNDHGAVRQETNALTRLLTLLNNFNFNVFAADKDRFQRIGEVIQIQDLYFIELSNLFEVVILSYHNRIEIGSQPDQLGIDFGDICEILLGNHDMVGKISFQLVERVEALAAPVALEVVAGIGAAGTLAIGVLRGRLKAPQIRAALVDALRVSSAIMMIVLGAYLFGYFLTITQFTQKAVEFLVQLPVGPYGVLALVMVGYFILGAVMDELAMILLTVPIVFPAMMQLGFDPVWFGVIIVMAVTFGMICPPVGINVFVINSIARDVPLGTIYRGTMPFIAIDVVRLVILCAFPSISLWLPSTMG